MNENVSIKEGNITRKFAPIDKLKVDNTDGTSSIWVPEDDLKTGVLYASENGIYIASEDGYDAYSEVVIRVEKRIDDGDLIDESDTDWKDIDFDGDLGNFDELDNWDVDTLEEFSDDLEGFDDLFNDEDKWDEEKEKPITEDEMGDFDGDSLSGIDPETGNEMEVSLDEDGFLDEEMLPSAIHIVIKPRKLEYIDGERIDYSGIHVYLLDANNQLFTSDKYPTGEIPFSELYFPTETAKFDFDNLDGEYTNGHGLNAKHVTFSDSISIKTQTFYKGSPNGTCPPDVPGWGSGGTLYEACAVSGSAYITRYNERLYGYGISIAAARFAGILPPTDPTSWFTGQWGYGGQFAIQRWTSLGNSFPLNIMTYPVSTVDPENIEDMSDLSKAMVVPVVWTRSDGEALQDTFDIMVSNGTPSTGQGGSVPVTGNDSSHIGGNF